ncbi:hypothetical protein Tco_1090975 [Tanacetum coccineum]|uniref:Uncharacterized protein n=1 Tax=Tanacetum coccineum TaxID=301880 RepID=A0ABQ5I7M8_9ASTR
MATPTISPSFYGLMVFFPSDIGGFTTEPKTPPTTTTTTLLEDDDVTVAATHVRMSETSKAKSIVFEDVEESAKEQREGKAPMVEEDVPPPKKTQKQLDDERAGLEEAMRL